MSRSSALTFATGAVVVLVAALPTLRFGFVMGHDWVYETVRVYEFHAALRDGQFPPAWGPNQYRGYGAPTFVFYGATFLAIAAVAFQAIGDVFIASSVAQVLVSALGVVSVVVLGWAWRVAAAGDAGGAPTRVAMALLTLQPYLLADRYVRNANAELTALASAPLILAGVFIVGARPRVGAVLLAVGVGLTTLSHNMMALATVGIGVVACVVLYAGRGGRATWSAIAVGHLLGVGIAAVAWVSTIVYAGDVRLDEAVPPYADYPRHFITFGRVFSFESLVGLGPLPPLVVLATALTGFKRGLSRLERAALLGCAAASVVLLSLTMAWTDPVWRAVPFLPVFQFPWRMLGPLAVTTAAGGLVLAHVWLRGMSPARRRWAEAIALACIVGNAAPTLLAVAGGGVAARAELGAMLNESDLRRSTLTAQLSHVFLPRTADLDATVREPGLVGRVSGAPDGAGVSLVDDSGTRCIVDVDTPTAGEVTFARWAFDGWEARVDDQNVAWRATSSGAIAVPVSVGVHRVELRYRNPPARRLAWAVTLIATLVTLGVAVRNRRSATLH